MQLNRIAISAKAITMKVEENKDTDDKTNDIVSSTRIAQEEPLDTLTSAWDELKKVFVEILELPNSYTEGLTITALSIRRTKQGTRSAILEATKQLECRQDFLHKMEAPCVQIEAAAEGESGAVQIDKKLADIVTKAIHEAERYMQGERSQTLLNFEEAKDGLQATADLGKGELGLEGTNG